jgi:ribA/ribD-fused uncharacterized protein
MASDDPKQQKGHGHERVRNFSAGIWNEVAKEIVYVGNMAKFSNPSLKEYILGTENKEIVEASPYDTVWGIGLSESNPDRFDKTKWKGTNWLGEVLMRVRRDLRSQR